MPSFHFWLIFNFIFGLFPFLFGIGRQKDLRIVWLGYVFLVGRTFMAFQSSSILCSLYNFPTTVPQKYVCFLVFYGNMVVSLHRLLVSKATKELWGKLEQTSFPKQCFTIGSTLAFALVFLDGSKLLAFSLSDRLPLWLRLYLAMGYISIWGPLLVESQFIVLCYSVQNGLTTCRILLQNGSFNRDLIEAAKKNLNRQTNLFEMAMNCYGFDAFLSMSLSLVYSCVILNDFINIALQYAGYLVIDKNTAPWTIQVILLKVVYFMCNIIRENMFLIWFSGIASKLKGEVTAISQTLYRMDHTKVDIQIKNEVVLLLEQLNDIKFEVNACGFFIVCARFVFKSFSTSLTYIFLFIQLSQLTLQRNMT